MTRKLWEVIHGISREKILFMFLVYNDTLKTDYMYTGLYVTSSDYL